MGPLLALVSFVLLLVQVLLIARAVLDWSVVLAGPTEPGSVRSRLTSGVHAVTEPILAPVRRILLRDGRAAGVELENGQQLTAKVVVSSLHPRTAFLDHVGRANRPDDFVTDMEFDHLARGLRDLLPTAKLIRWGHESAATNALSTNASVPSTVRLPCSFRVPKRRPTIAAMGSAIASTNMAMDAVGASSNRIKSQVAVTYQVAEFTRDHSCACATWRNTAIAMPLTNGLNRRTSSTDQAEIASTSASKVSRLIDAPKASSSAIEPSKHTGTVTAGTIAARTLPRKR